MVVSNGSHSSLILNEVKNLAIINQTLRKLRVTRLWKDYDFGYSILDFGFPSILCILFILVNILVTFTFDF